MQKVSGCDPHKFAKTELSYSFLALLHKLGVACSYVFFDEFFIGKEFLGVGPLLGFGERLFARRHIEEKCRRRVVIQQNHVSQLSGQVLTVDSQKCAFCISVSYTLYSSIFALMMGVSFAVPRQKPGVGIYVLVATRLAFNILRS